uniref:uncharacterized protein LOC106992798 n=1 Tax=Macaca mulatta TaxID=9544 RepID=UPI0010A1F958|nr:uncharacterized protein LOC106992798 [Macaca mulatta]
MAGPPQTLRRQPREASGSRGEAWSRLARPCGETPRPSGPRHARAYSPGSQGLAAPPVPAPTSSEAASSRCPRPGVPATEPRPGPLPPPPPQSPLTRARQRAHLRGAPSRPPPARSAAPAKAPTRSLCSPGDPGPPSPRSNGGGGSDRRKPGGGDGEGGIRRRGPRTALWDPESHRPFRARKPAGVGLQVPAGRERGAGLTCAPRGSLGPRVPPPIPGPEVCWRCTTSPGRPRERGGAHMRAARLSGTPSSAPERLGLRLPAGRAAGRAGHVVVVASRLPCLALAGLLRLLAPAGRRLRRDGGRTAFPLGSALRSPGPSWPVRPRALPASPRGSTAAAQAVGLVLTARR